MTQIKDTYVLGLGEQSSYVNITKNSTPFPIGCSQGSILSTLQNALCEKVIIIHSSKDWQNQFRDRTVSECLALTDCTDTLRASMPSLCLLPSRFVHSIIMSVSHHNKSPIRCRNQCPLCRLQMAIAIGSTTLSVHSGRGRLPNARLVPMVRKIKHRGPHRQPRDSQVQPRKGVPLRKRPRAEAC